MRLASAVSGDHGGKAAGLARALAAGLPVPDGVVLTPAEAADATRSGTPAATRLNGELRQLSPRLAVRSSAIGEDGARHSFAGHHATRLNVEGGAAVRAAIAAVLASASSAAALRYRERHGIEGPVAMGVLIQELVPAEVAGVLFTRDPVAGTDGCVVEAAWGIGEAVAAGLVVPDRYRLAADGSVLEAEIGHKDVEVVALPSGGIAERPVDVGRARRPCLSTGQLALLARLGGRCEALLGRGQDVEWAFGRGRLHLLQSRPITTGGSAGSGAATG